MNETEKKYLEALHRDRSDSADTFEKEVLPGRHGCVLF